MRLFVLAVILFGATAASAQKEWAPAPVPNVGPNKSVAPMERAGRTTGADRSAPFSDIPNGTAASGGVASSNDGDAVGTPSVSR